MILSRDYLQARQFQQSGRWAEALAVYQSLLRIQPKNGQLLFEAGCLALKLGQAEQSVSLFKRLLKLEPGHVGGLSNLGQAHARLGRHRRALDCYRQAIARQPNFAGGHYNAGLAEQALGQPENALASYDSAIALDPGFAPAHNNRGNILHVLRRHREAIQSFDAALQLVPHNADAWYNRGLAFYALDSFAEAVQSHRRALAIQPDHVDAWQNCALCHEALQEYRDELACLEQQLRLQPERGEVHLLHAHVLFALEEWPQAEAAYRQAIAMNRVDADTLVRLGSVLQRLGQNDQALEIAARALALDPGYPPTHNLQGSVLHHLHRDAEAIPCLQQAIALDPSEYLYYYNLALSLAGLRRFAEAETAFDQALSIAPQNADTLFGKALLLLTQGDFARGWPLYEARWQAVQKHYAPAFSQPLWLGETPLDGKTLLVLGEQGLGDFIQFCRYIPMLSKRAGRVVVKITPLLASLAEALQADIDIVLDGQPLPTFDCYCPLLSLPLALAATVGDIPAVTPYLFPTPPAEAAIKSPATPPGRLRVGLFWHSNSTFMMGHLRNLPLVELLDLLVLPCEFHVLQQEVSSQDQALLAKLDGSAPRLHRLNDFADTAALLQQLDLVVSVDTSIAHLAGALAVPVWILLPYRADFRWQVNRSDSPWYPSARLFRQPAPGDWRNVVYEVRQALYNAVNTGSYCKARQRLPQNLP